MVCGDKQLFPRRRFRVIEWKIAPSRCDVRPRAGASASLLCFVNAPMTCLHSFEAMVEAFVSESGTAGIRWVARDLKPPVLYRAAELFRDGRTVRQVADLLGVSRSEAGRLRVRAAADGVVGGARRSKLLRNGPHGSIRGCPNVPSHRTPWLGTALWPPFLRPWPRWSAENQRAHKGWYGQPSQSRRHLPEADSHPVAERSPYAERSQPANSQKATSESRTGSLSP